MATWIDFKSLRERISFIDVLKRYGVEYKRRGKGQAQGYCPLPGHRSRNAGHKPRSPSFSVSFVKNSFHCFGCQAHGNVLDFAAYMEGLNPAGGADIRTAALCLQEWFPDNQRSAGRPKQTMPHKSAKESRTAELNSSGAAHTKHRVLVNHPLDFSLKNLDQDHSYLRDRGFTRGTIEHFGLGVCNRGMLKGRVAIPLT